MSPEELYDRAISMVSAGRDRQALVLVGCEIVEALRDLAAAYRQPPTVIVTQADLDPERIREVAAMVRGEAVPATSEDELLPTTPVPVPPRLQGKRR